MIYAIDLGHGVRFDTGAVGIRTEEQCINEVGKRVIEKLRSLNHKVIECRPPTAKDLNDSLAQRCYAANTAIADLFVSIHFNAGGGKGSEIYAINDKSKIYAKSVLMELANLGYVSRGIKNNQYYVLRNTISVIPAILVECAFIDSQEDMARYCAEDIANAMVKGLTGQDLSVKPQGSKYYVVTNYLPVGDYGIEMNEIYQKYLTGVGRWYLKHNDKGVWVETQYITKEAAEALSDKLKADGLFWELVVE